MKLLLALSALAVAKATDENNFFLGVRTEGSIARNTGNSETSVSEEEAISAVHAANDVYYTDSSNCAGYKYGTYTNGEYGYSNDWICKANVEKPHNFWFGDVEGLTIRFQYFEAPDNKCGIVFRGTNSNLEHTANAQSSATITNPALWWYGEHAHNGYVEAFNKIIGDFSYFAGQVNDINHSRHTKCKNGFYLVGHSLGGGLATLAHLFWEHKYKSKAGYVEAKSITFGAPQVIYKVDPPKTINTLRFFQSWDFIASNFGLVQINYEHRGPAKEFVCEIYDTLGDTCYCLRVRVVERENHDAKSNFFTPCKNHPQLNMHSMMQTYIPYVTAKATLENGKKCGLHDDCSSGLCNWDYQCEAKRDDGEYCSSNTFCSSGYCPAHFVLAERKCYPKGDVGDKCQTNDSCHSGQCSMVWGVFRCV